MSYLSNLFSLNKESKIVILGLGVENQQFLVWLIKVANFSTNQIIIADKVAISNFEIEGQMHDLKDFETVFGDNYLSILNDRRVEWVFKTPGIWSLMPELQWFRDRHGHDRVLGSMTFFIEKFREQIIGINGTKGKSTTCSMLTHLLSQKFQTEGYQQVHYCGNTVGVSPYQFWKELEQEVNPGEFFVIELSSFQLQDIGFAALSPKYSAITNYYIDHLDQHAHVYEYWKSKDQIFEHQKAGDYLVVGEWLNEHYIDRERMYFDLQEGDKWNKYMISEVLNKEFILPDSVFEQLRNTFTTQLPGQHNWQNLVLALILYQLIISKNPLKMTQEQALQLLENPKNSSQIQSYINTFRPLAHRLELIHSVTTQLKNSSSLTIQFWDDGAATEPDAVIAAVKALTTRPNEFLWLQITGKDKGGEIIELAGIIKDNANDKIIRADLCGAVGLRIKNHHRLPELQETQISNFRSLVQKDLVNLNQMTGEFQSWLDQYFNSGIITSYILNICLSPCGSSFDEFSNYKERSNWWKEKVQKLT